MEDRVDLSPVSWEAQGSQHNSAASFQEFMESGDFMDALDAVLETEPADDVDQDPMSAPSSLSPMDQVPASAAVASADHDDDELATVEGPAPVVQLRKRRVAKGPSRRTHKKARNDMPKRSLSAYNLFFRDERRKVLVTFPSLGFSELGKEIGKRWQNLDETRRREYLRLAEADADRYHDEMLEHQQNHRAKNQLERKEETDTESKPPARIVETPPPALKPTSPLPQVILESPVFQMRLRLPHQQMPPPSPFGYNPYHFPEPTLLDSTQVCSRNLISGHMEFYNITFKCYKMTKLQAFSYVNYFGEFVTVDQLLRAPIPPGEEVPMPSRETF